MIFLGATDYYFWQGIEAGVKKLNPSIKLSQRSQVAKDSELAYQDGYSLGLELSLRDFNLLTKPKVRLRAKKVTQKVSGPQKQDVDEFNNRVNINIRGNC